MRSCIPSLEKTDKRGSFAFFLQNARRLHSTDVWLRSAASARWRRLQTFVRRLLESAEGVKVGHLAQCVGGEKRLPLL